jgi:hypothetical protein
LLLDGPYHVGRGEIAIGHLLWIEPQSHAVIALADVRDIADAGETGEFVFELNRGVVAEIQTTTPRR